MTKEKLIEYHEEKINRLYEQRDAIQQRIHEYSKKGSHLRTDELLNFINFLINIDRELKSSIEVRMAMMNLES